MKKYCFFLRKVWLERLICRSAGPRTPREFSEFLVITCRDPCKITCQDFSQFNGQKCTRLHRLTSRFQKFSGGACPRTPLDWARTCGASHLALAGCLAYLMLFTPNSLGESPKPDYCLQHNWKIMPWEAWPLNDLAVFTVNFINMYMVKMN